MLGWLGYDRDYIAFGNDVLATPAEDRWAFNWIFVPNLFMGRYYLQTDTECNVTGMYDYIDDVLMTTDLKDSLPEQRDMMQRKVKALMQSYLERMEADSVRVRQSAEPSL